jgi:hypothetical protein
MAICKARVPLSADDEKNVGTVSNKRETNLSLVGCVVCSFGTLGTDSYSTLEGESRETQTITIEKGLNKATSSV